MKTLFRTGTAFFVFLCLTASASGVPCVPKPPKDLTGHLNVLHPGQSVAVEVFKNNGCSWDGLEGLNGTDGVVLDVAGMGGTGSFTATLGQTSTVFLVVQGHFLDEGCQPIAGGEFHTTTTPAANPLAQLITIPATAKWMVIDSTDANAGNDINLSVHYDGLDCPTKNKPKKKKKRR